MVSIICLWCLNVLLYPAYCFPGRYKLEGNMTTSVHGDVNAGKFDATCWTGRVIDIKSVWWTNSNSHALIWLRQRLWKASTKQTRSLECTRQGSCRKEASQDGKSQPAGTANTECDPFVLSALLQYVEYERLHARFLLLRNTRRSFRGISRDDLCRANQPSDLLPSYERDYFQLALL
jgi:hypothetical protein